jgi:hypothetical protein
LVKCWPSSLSIDLRHLFGPVEVEPDLVASSNEPLRQHEYEGWQWYIIANWPVADAAPVEKAMAGRI